jgi:hypothetical protein
LALDHAAAQSGGHRFSEGDVVAVLRTEYRQAEQRAGRAAAAAPAPVADRVAHVLRKHREIRAALTVDMSGGEEGRTVGRTTLPANPSTSDMVGCMPDGWLLARESSQPGYLCAAPCNLDARQTRTRSPLRVSSLFIGASRLPFAAPWQKRRTSTCVLPAWKSDGHPRRLQ